LVVTWWLDPCMMWRNVGNYKSTNMGFRCLYLSCRSQKVRLQFLSLQGSCQPCCIARLPFVRQLKLWCNGFASQRFLPTNAPTSWFNGGSWAFFASSICPTTLSYAVMAVAPVVASYPATPGARAAVLPPNL